MKKFEFVFVSKDNNFKIDRDTTKAFQKMHENVCFKYIPDNKHSLADVYNVFIKHHRAEKDADFLVLMHADVNLNLDDFISHLEKVEGKYDVIGLCGCTKISVAQQPLNWYTGSRPYPESRWGCVTHGEIGNHISFFSSHSPDITDHEVACIDGLCIVLTRNAIENSDILFDYTFAFSHYDTDISFECVMKKNLKLGVIVQKDLQHWSIGRSILTPGFLESEKKFRDKWFIQNQVS